jgi:drug/metabolite transporter (DMT)-like permease
MLRRVAMPPEPETPAAELAPALRPAQKLREPLCVALALLGFAANSLLCRLALAPPARIDALSFTLVRLLSGAAMLLLLAGLRRAWAGASLRGALALWVYMLAFSGAYLRVGAALGALLLFGAVQATMLGVALIRGERLAARAWLGLLAALSGLGWLLSPGVGAPPLDGAALMLLAGAAWGAYSLLGRRATDALGTTAGNFAVAALALAVLAAIGAGGSVRVAGAALQASRWTASGAGLAVASGALASGLGYALWYRGLPWLGASRAAIVQLMVPVLAAALAVPLLGEALRLRLLGAGALVLSGVALALLRPARGP